MDIVDARKRMDGQTKRLVACACHSALLLCNSHFTTPPPQGSQAVVGVALYGVSPSLALVLSHSLSIFGTLKIHGVFHRHDRRPCRFTLSLPACHALFFSSSIQVVLGYEAEAAKFCSMCERGTISSAAQTRAREDGG